MYKNIILSGRSAFMCVHLTTVCIAARQPKIEPLKTAAVRIFEPETHTFNTLFTVASEDGTVQDEHTHTHYVRSGPTNNRIYIYGRPEDVRRTTHTAHTRRLYNNAQLVFEGSSSLVAAATL